MGFLFNFSIIRMCGELSYKCARNLSSSKYVKSDSEYSHFGYETVRTRDKNYKVAEVFHRVADTYDVMNDVMSAGIHRFWKDIFMSRLNPTLDLQLLDMAGGTGDIAFRFLKHIKQKSTSTDCANPLDYQDIEANVTVGDINASMLEVGKHRAAERGITSGISWVETNAEELSFEDNSFDAYTIAFGIRNCTHIDKVLREAMRVLKPGGRFLCLEFSNVTNPAIEKLYDFYSHEIISVMGQVVAGDWKSYKYLVESIRRFPNKDVFANMIKSAGFRVVSYEDLTFGVVAIHSGFKLPS